MRKEGYLIEFEGLDCSFKETNANRLKKLLDLELQKKGIQKKVVVVSFPDYLSGSSFFVRQYLAGKYPDNCKSAYLINDVLRISSFYFMDMYHKWINTIKPLYDNGDIIIFDRYIISSIIYQSASYIMKNTVTEEELPEVLFELQSYILDLANNTYRLPNADYKIYMEMDIEKIIDLVAEKREKTSTKDIIEENTEYLRNAYYVYMEWLYLEQRHKAKYSIINLLDKNNFLKTRTEIEKELNTIIKTMMETDSKFKELFTKRRDIINE